MVLHLVASATPRATHLPAARPLRHPYRPLRAAPTRGPSEPMANPLVNDVNGSVPSRTFEMLRFALVPADPAGRTWLEVLSFAGGLIVVALLPIALLARRWLLVALLLGWLISVMPYTPLILGVSPAASRSTQRSTTSIPTLRRRNGSRPQRSRKCAEPWDRTTASSSSGRSRRYVASAMVSPAAVHRSRNASTSPGGT